MTKTTAPRFFGPLAIMLALALPALLIWCSKKAFYWTIPIGFIMGLWIWVAYFIAYSILG